MTTHLGKDAQAIVNLTHTATVTSDALVTSLSLTKAQKLH